MTISLITPPTGEPVTAVLAKAYARITHSYEDSLVDLWISAAREHCENVLDRPIRQAGYRVSEVSPDAAIAVAGLGPFTVTQARSITGGVPTTIPSTDYSSAWDYGQMVITHNTAWPSADSIEIDFTVGYADVPMPIKQAILVLVGDMDRNREAATTEAVGYSQNPAVQNLLYPYRVLGL